jgi:hypothetical protein
MIELTPDARRRFDEYLQRTRSALRGTRSIEATEVEQNVIEHVELALAGVPAPIGTDALRTVLEQLGPPERWLPDDELPMWRRLLGRLMTGPEDWRLAYLSFAVTVLMVFTFPIGGVLVLPLAFVLSRACVALLRERGEPLGPKAWLVLPPIVLALFLFVTGALILGAAAPAVFASENGLQTLGFPEPVDRADRLRMSIGLVGLSAGVWWIVLSGLFALLFTPIRSLFAPVLDSMKRGHLLVLTLVGTIVAGLGAVVLWAF